MKNANQTDVNRRDTDVPLVNRQTFRQEIREYLEKAILTDVLKPGDRILETHWAKQFGVSQAPVREAIRDLEAIGLIETKPFCGSTVRQLTDKNIVDNFSVRSCLEEMAIRTSIDHLKETDLKELEKEMKGMKSAAKKNDLTLFVTHDEQFHELIVKLSNNDVLFRLWKQCNIRDWTNMTALAADMSIDIMAQMHETVFDAILSRNADNACKSIREHLDTFSEILIRSRNSGE